MSPTLTTQMLSPSLRRVYRSRAACTAISSSGACRDPTCTWLRPRLPRTNTSYSGQSRRLTARNGTVGAEGRGGGGRAGRRGRGGRRGGGARARRGGAGPRGAPGRRRRRGGGGGGRRAE